MTLTPEQLAVLRQLRDARRFLRLRQQTVSDYLAMKRQSYAAIENGLRNLTVMEMVQLCNLYRVTPDRLLGFEREATMTTEQLAALKEVAERATPGPWKSRPNADFIAAFDPTTCLALLEEVERLRQALKGAKDDSDAAAIESRWRSSQGEDYGSY